jgi:glyoxylase-like metal-dependent hydrolase (beta-lactamase superfamily II)
MTRRLNLILFAVLLLVSAPFYWLLLDNTGSGVAAKPVSIEQLRELSGTMPGARPNSVTFELAAFRLMPGNLLVAGSGMKRKLVGVMAWRLDIPGGKPVMIDSGIQQKDASNSGSSKFHADAQQRIERSLGEAGLVLLTHEHLDHAGGVMALAADSPVRAAVRLNPAQAKAPGLSGTATLPGGSAPFAVAPGIVVIPAPSHTPGSQLIFVVLADGTELLFVGDVSSFTQNWAEGRARSRLVSQYILSENRSEVFSWLHTIAALKQADPALLVIPGHDFEWVYNPQNKVPARRGFYAPVV